MRNVLALFLLFSGAMLLSCSQEGDSSIEENEMDGQSQGDDSELEQTETELEDPTDNNVLADWKSYHNERFDFCVDFPSSFLSEKGESENHDGNTFANANGSSEMRASAMHNVLDQTINESFVSATENRNYYDEERIITYKQQNDNWFVVSGNYNESIFYVRTVLENGTYYTLYFEYHSSEEEKFKEIIERASKDFPKC